MRQIMHFATGPNIAAQASPVVDIGRVALVLRATMGAWTYRAPVSTALLHIARESKPAQPGGMASM
jgi:hypothetical protein